MIRHAWLIPFIPGVCFFIILLLGKRMPQKGAEVGVTGLAIAFTMSCVVAYQWIDRPADMRVSHVEAVESAETPEHAGEEGEEPHEETGLAAEEEEAADVHGPEFVRRPVDRSVTWFESGPVKVGAGTRIDGLAVMMLLVVTFVSLLVHIYSTSYMEGDRRFTFFFAALSLFSASMLLLVVADNTLVMLVGWELVGLCSFMLIGHWWEEKPNSDAALKAFFTTRVGDAGFVVGIVILFFAAGRTFNIASLNQAALSGEIGHTVLLLGAIGLFCGVIGKSAQFPLHTWLPDAMAGPTPVSALIHAATMVVAGVYLIARLYGVFWSAFSIEAGALNAVALIGGVTLLIAALLAFVQDDIKKVLAYSTVSQLGYMVMALGVGAWTAGIFHLFTHAFFKALLFLGSGSVSHAVHSFDMKKGMGGLRRPMPVTFWTFVIGSVALAGIPPLAGFWSKDEILVGAGENGYAVFLVIGLVGAAMTAAYMARTVWLTFFGEFRGHGHPHESPATITAPLTVLAACSVVAGLLNAPGIELFGKWTENEVVLGAGVEHHEFSVVAALLSSAVALGGLASGWFFYARDVGPHGLTRRSALANSGYKVLLNRYYLDHLYTGVVVGSIKGPMARAAYWVNQNVLDGIVHGIALAARGVARFVYDVIDQRVVDGAVNGTGATVGEGGAALRTLQTGRVQQYAAFLFGAVAVMALVLVVIT